MDAHLLWLYAHIVLFVYWLGADVGLFLIMVFLRNPQLGFETRATLIRLAFWIDQFPRVSFALLIPVGLQLIRDLGLYPVTGGMLVAAWTIGVSWSLLHLAVVRYRGTRLARALHSINQLWELVAGGLFIAVGIGSLAAGAPIAADWLALKLLLFGLIFWVVLGIDTVFQPFTAILRMGPDGSTPEGEAAISRQLRLTMGWALLLYVLILAVAFLGKVKPLW